MADYTIVNLHELENMAPKFNHDKDMEARFATKPLKLEKSGLGLQKVLPGRTIPFKHKHAKQEEVVVVVAGSGNIHMDKEVVELKQWDAVRVAPEVVRTLEAGSNGLEVLIIGAPFTGKNDVEMVSK